MNYRRPLLNLSTEVDINVRDNTFELSEAFKQTMLSKEHTVRMVNCGDGVREVV